MITEADEASDTLQEAIERFEYQVIQYRAGLETNGVVDMYELTCIKMGATSQQIQDIWNRHEE